MQGGNKPYESVIGEVKRKCPKFKTGVSPRHRAALRKEEERKLENYMQNKLYRFLYDFIKKFILF